MPPSSYQKINYSLRIGKSIERKMLVDVFRKLSVFNKLSKYRYIGFGSTFFTDFALFHKHLSIKEMISIEKQVDDKERFDFNKPYSCIEIIFDKSNNVLPGIGLEKSQSILWLDYDGHLDEECLNDIGTFFTNAQSGSFFVITVNAHADTLSINLLEESDDGEHATVNNAEHIRNFREQKLIERVGSSKVPRELTNSDFTSKKFPDIYYDIVKNEIENVLVGRNGVLEMEDQFVFKQILNIEYQDGAKMLTIGGVLVKNKDLQTLKDANFEELDYYRPGKGNRFKIEVPSLTFKELRYLDAYLPTKINADGRLFKGRKNLSCVPLDDVIKYKKLYKYFPTFAEAIV